MREGPEVAVVLRDEQLPIVGSSQPATATEAAVCARHPPSRLAPEVR